MRAILIAGPTASGKSRLALRLAEQHGGAVVNADSMQVYDTLNVLTARPPEAETAAVEHRLYGHVPATRLYSVGQWRRDVEAVLADLRARGKMPVIVGGTGLYFHVLLDGLSAIPPIPDEIRAGWRERLSAEGAPALHALLAEKDPATAASLAAKDGQRIARALEVLEASGRSIRVFQSEQGKSLLDPNSVRKVLLMPERTDLHRRIEKRFHQMVDHGALEEARSLLRLDLDPALPVMKAIGVRELGNYLAGRNDLETAIERATAATRQYAKRQTTWFRNRFDDSWQIAVDPGLVD